VDSETRSPSEPPSFSIAGGLASTHKVPGRGDKINEAEVVVRVLNAERTFWEKATILHSIAHYPVGKTTPVRMSRHYYDFFKMLETPLKEEASKTLDLLNRVAIHKSIFFRAGWAKYNEAKPGSLRLIPSKERIKDLTEDFQQMKEMFFENPGTFEHIIDELASFEKIFNMWK
jgi:hypothetical protein